MYRGLIVVVMVATLLGGQAPGARAEVARVQSSATGRMVVSQADSCSDPLNEGRRPELGATLAFEEREVGPPGTLGRPYLCVISYPREEVFHVVFQNIDRPEQFRAAKAETIGKLQARGIDLCRVTMWSFWGVPNQAGYSDDDFYSLPVPCPVRVVTGDADAPAYVPTVQQAIQQGLEATVAEYGWHPTRPITIVLVTNEDSAAELYARYRREPETVEDAARVGREGGARIFATLDPGVPYGNISLLNISDPSERTTANIDQQAQYTLAYFAISDTVGIDTSATGNPNNIPTWMRDGLIYRYSYRHALNGASGGFMVEAARAVSDGQFPLLTDMVTQSGRVAVVKRLDAFAVGAREYAAVAYLYDRYGEDTMKQFLQASHNRTKGDVQAILTQILGHEVDALDGRLNAWLLERPRILAASADGRIKIDLRLFQDGQHGEALVEEAATTCFFNVERGATDTGQPGLVGFSVTLGPDGTFTAVRPSTYVGNSVTLSGRLVNGQLSGSYRVVNEVTACDSGPTLFGAS